MSMKKCVTTNVKVSRLPAKGGGEVALDEHHVAGMRKRDVGEGDPAEHVRRGLVMGPRVDKGVDDTMMAASPAYLEETVDDVLIHGPLVVGDLEA